MNKAVPVVCVLCVAALVVVIAGGRVGSQAVAQGQPADASRYSTQVVAIPGLLEPAFCITDHRDQKLYMYLPDKQSLKLKTTIDLSKAGNVEIEVVRAQEPSTRPAK
jgi:hypothetical protein